jgi:adenylylsulfate kinase
LMVDAGLIVITAFISPFRADREMVRNLFKSDEFIEIHLAADLATCEARDPKGLYAKARKGEIKDFTGLDSPYEGPIDPEIRLDSGIQTVPDELEKVIRYMLEHGYLKR